LIAAARARQPRPLVLCSLRDIVIAPELQLRQREIVDTVHADFDAVLVHGDPNLIPLDASFPLASEIEKRLVYTGYVTKPGALTHEDTAAGVDEVLVSAGGGAVGGALMRTALAARRQGCLADSGWRLLAGPNLPATEFAALGAALPDRVIVERYRVDFPQMLGRCRVSVSQAGYNTVLEILGAGVPAVLVPFAEQRETEQTLRAERLASAGVIEMVAPTALEPDRLASAIERAIQGRPAALKVDTEGADRTARLLAGMISGETVSGICRNFNVPADDYRSGK
jgi:predicted glycosyltransferase